VIVGFPGESDNDFLDTYNFTKKIDLSYLHVFTYSERENTSSQKIASKIDSSIKAMRRDKLKRLSTIKYRKFIDDNIDRELNILFEKYTDGILSGWTENYIRVNVESKKNYTNQIKTVKLMDNHSINGVLV
jgi:threonylcarbamoyladenosine tRNA methylthiotransferase MtaB